MQGHATVEELCLLWLHLSDLLSVAGTGIEGKEQQSGRNPETVPLRTVGGKVICYAFSVLLMHYVEERVH